MISCASANLLSREKLAKMKWIPALAITVPTEPHAPQPPTIKTTHAHALWGSRAGSATRTLMSALSQRPVETEAPALIRRVVTLANAERASKAVTA